MCWNCLSFFIFGTGGILFGRARCPELAAERAGVGLVVTRVEQARVLSRVVCQIDREKDLCEYPDDRPKELEGK